MKEFLVEYFWHLLALAISPLAGFMMGQYYKINTIPKPSAARIALVAGGLAALLASWLWPGTIDERAKIGVLVGIMQPLIVWIWFKAAHKFAPDQAVSLGGSNGDLTILPWVTVKKKHKDEPDSEAITDVPRNG